MSKLRVNMVSESDVSVQGHGVHTAYVEIAKALERRDDITVLRGYFNQTVACDIVHVHTIGTKTWRKLFQKGPKKVVSAHVIPASFVGSIRMAKYWLPLAHLYMRWYYNRADKVLAVSQTVADVLHKNLKVPVHKIEVFYNSIDMSRYKSDGAKKLQARKSLNIHSDKFVVLGNGQVQPRKRLDVFIELAKQMPDVQFVWVGGINFGQLGAEYQSMQKLIDAAPQNMRVTGVIPHEEVREYLAAADAFCLPAEQENHPMCVLEAAGAGLPIVLRDIPEYNDTFKDDGWRCTTLDDFAHAIQSLRTDEAKYDQYVAGAAQIAERFDSSAASDRLVKIYRELL